MKTNLAAEKDGPMPAQNGMSSVFCFVLVGLVFEGVCVCANLFACCLLWSFRY